MAEFEIKGVDVIERALKELEPKLARKVFSQSIRAGLKPVQAAVKANVPIKSGLLRKSIKVRALKRKTGRIGLTVQIGQGDFKGETYYGAFVEYGTSRMPGKGFMRRGFDTTAQTAKATMLNLITAGIEREATSK